MPRSIPNAQPLTPKPLRFLVFATLICGILVALLDKFLPGTPPSQYLGLSLNGIEKGYLWQFLTYILIAPPERGLSFSELISMGFNAYLLWILGSMVYERKGAGHFFAIYLGSAVLSGVLVLLCQYLNPGPLPYGGNTGAVFAILIAWLMLHPNAEMVFFLMIPLKAKWLISLLVGLSLFVDISVGAYTHLAAYLSGAVFGYLYCLIAWESRSPYRFLSPFEQGLLKALSPLRRKSPGSFYPKAKIYDFKTGRAILKDNEFMDAMLSKISLYGKESLTWRERWRLKRISRKREKNQKTP